MRESCRQLFITLCLLCVVGCQEEPGPPPPPTKSAASVESKTETKAESSTASSERKAYGGLKFIVPEGWSDVPLSQMQMGILAGKLSMPDRAPDVVLTLSRSGGSLEDNLDRWRGQFSASRPESVTTLSVAGVQSTLIDLEGGFSPGMGRPDITNARMLGAIVPLEGQGYFIKLTGPADQVGEVEDEFRDFLNSAARE